MLFHPVLCHDENDRKEDKNNACLCRQHNFEHTAVAKGDTQNVSNI